MKAITHRLAISALIIGVSAMSSANSRADSGLVIPAPLANPLKVEQSYGSQTEEPYKAPPFCGEPADDTMNLYIQEPNGLMEAYGEGQPIHYTAKNVRDFICNMLPVAIRMDRIIFHQRRYIESLMSKSESITDSEVTWLKSAKLAYGLPATASNDSLLERVDVIPIPLLLAQGALESAWGQSRFAKQGSNYFGIHGSLKKDGASNCMMSASGGVCVRKYSGMSAGIADYTVFLNVQPSQNPLRQARADARARRGDIDVPLDSIALAETMSKYSEIGQAYTDRVVAMMKNYNLTDFAFDESLIPPLANENRLN